MALDLRVPGTAVVERIAQMIGGAGRLPLDTVPRIASRLSGVSEAAIASLPANDLAAIRHAIESLFHQQSRRMSAARKP